MVRLTDRHDMALDVYRGRKTTKQQQQKYLGGDVVVEEVCVCGLVERDWSYIRKFCTG